MNHFRFMAAKEDCCPKKTIFLAAWGSCHQNADMVSGTDLRLYAETQPNPFSSVGGEASRTYR